MTMDSHAALIAQRLGFGCGRLKGGHEKANALRLVHAALDMGLRHFDTAPPYGLGMSEAVLGEALKGRQEDVTVVTKAGLADWLGGLGPGGSATVYQWHHDSFTVLPPGARLLAASPACGHQAFAIGPHLGMQFHIEITPAKIEAWLANAGSVYPQAVEQGLPTVQSPAAMRASTAQHQAGSQALADVIYAAWRRRWKAV